MQPIRENPKTIKYLTQEEVSRLFSKIHDKRDRAMFNVVYKYVLRASAVNHSQAASRQITERMT